MRGFALPLSCATAAMFFSRKDEAMFQDVVNFIKGAVGNNRENFPGDILAVKEGLSDAGYFDADKAPEPHGYITREMDKGIRDFQRDRGLRVDGYLRPGGQGQDKQAAFLPLHSLNTTSLTVNGKKAMSENMPLVSEDSATINGKSFLMHYKEGNGKPVKLTSEAMEESSSFADAMETNRRRFEDSMFIGEVRQKDGSKKQHVFYNQLLGLKDGETIFLNAPSSPGGGDYWDRDISRYEGLLHGDVKQSLGTGAIKLRSTGNLKAVRKGNMIHIDGIVDHNVRDVYNFNPEDPEFSHFRKMAKDGKAVPFLLYGSKLERLHGTLTIENGRITEHNFQWEPIDRRRIP